MVTLFDPYRSTSFLYYIEHFTGRTEWILNIFLNTVFRNSMKPTGGSPNQLTIFYGGTVNVYNDITPEKVFYYPLLTWKREKKRKNEPELYNFASFEVTCYSFAGSGYNVFGWGWGCYIQHCTSKSSSSWNGCKNGCSK